MTKPSAIARFTRLASVVLRQHALQHERLFNHMRIHVPLNTFRMWDSGLRPAPSHLVQRAGLAVADHARNTTLLSLDQLAREFGVHARTLRAAARTGRLEVTFSSRSAFGRPMRLASRTAVQAFMRKDYRRYGGQSPAISPLPSVPRDYDVRLQRLRRRLRLTQHDLARRIGAANKAVVYQWESRQRTPSPVFWKRVEALGGARLDSRRTPIASMGSAADVSDSRHLKAPCPEAVSERFARPMARPRAPGEECPRRAQL
jgi:ribosome-binding protein aMBF1 (putative translation factor)